MKLSTVFQKTKALADLCRLFLYENEKKIKINKGRPARKDRQVLIPVPDPDLEIRGREGGGEGGGWGKGRSFIIQTLR